MYALVYWFLIIIFVNITSMTLLIIDVSFNSLFNEVIKRLLRDVIVQYWSYSIMVLFPLVALITPILCYTIDKKTHDRKTQTLVLTVSLINEAVTILFFVHMMRVT